MNAILGGSMTNAQNLAMIFLDITSISLSITQANFSNVIAMIVGTEWLIEAAGCDEAALRDEAKLRGLLGRVISGLGLRSIGEVWYKFPGEGGVTGLIALTESHLACHTYPEHQTATFNLYCCRTRSEWDWKEHLREALGAAEIVVQRIERGSSRSQGAGGGK